MCILAVSLKPRPGWYKVQKVKKAQVEPESESEEEAWKILRLHRLAMLGFPQKDPWLWETWFQCHFLYHGKALQRDGA